MPDIDPLSIKSLRERTNSGMMDCKRALIEANGDMGKAESILRIRGISSAFKKASRPAKEGIVVAFIQSSGKIGVLAEINCETDFVAKNDIFIKFSDKIVEEISISQSDNVATFLESLDSHGIFLKDTFATTIAALGENIILRRFTRFKIDRGFLTSYLHLHGKIGVLLEIACGNESTPNNITFREFAKEITLQITATNPLVIARDQIDSSIIASERAIYKEQVKDKSDSILEKIVDGKMEKFYATNCLLEQPCIKNPNILFKELIQKMEKELGDTINITRFVRYTLGEESTV